MAKAKKITASEEIEINEKERDAMIEKLADSMNPDTRFIAMSIQNLPEEQSEKMKKHYLRNGSEFYNAVFTGDTKTALELADEKDLEALNGKKEKRERKKLPTDQPDKISNTIAAARKKKVK